MNQNVLLIRNHGKQTFDSLRMSRGAEKQMRKLREAGVIKRIGGRYGGYREITTKVDKLN